MTAQQKLNEINEFLEGLLLTNLQPSHKTLINEIIQFIEDLDLEDTPDIMDMGINELSIGEE